MSSKAPGDGYDISGSNSSGNNVNAGIDSGFTSDPIRRGSLTPPELDSIHQTNSFKQAMKIQEEDNRELAKKTKEFQEAKEPIKQ